MAAKVRPLFVYGSLLSPEVLRVLLRRVPRMRSATIRGFRRYGLLERPYPAVCADAEGVVKGEIIFDLEPSEAEVLDDFEGDEYGKVQVEATIDGAEGTSIEVDLYAYAQRTADMQGQWSYDAFRDAHLESYVTMCEEYIADANSRGIGTLFSDRV